jgi:hypothetical protein
MSMSTAFVIVALCSPIIQAAPDGFPPLPDFNRRVDYVRWYERAVRVDEEDNAYPLYAEFMSGFAGGTVTEEDWPDFAGMLTSKETPPSPQPWDPAAHREWEASYERTRSVLKQLATAAKKKRLVAPSGLATGREAANNLLSRMRFDHLRTLQQAAKGTLEAAWRMRNRTVSAKKLLAAIQTNLRIARQLGHSLSRVEHAAAYEIRMQAYEHVAWALAHGVLEDKDVRKLRKMLQKSDGKPIDFSRAMRGEAAILLDSLQYIFGPLSSGGRPTLNGNRYREVTGQSMGGADRIGLGARLETDATGTARSIKDAYAKAERLLGPVYQERSMHNLRTTLDKMERRDNITKSICYLQGMHAARTYTMNAVCEAHRRATHLLVELHAYQAKKKKWPKKISSLGKKVRQRLGDDPFSGKLFKYRLTESGPLLYSVGLDGRDDDGEHREDETSPEQGGDIVFWPIPGSEESLAAGKMLQKKDEGLTPISAIGPDLEGKTVTVSAKVAGVSSEPSPTRGRRYVVTLSQAGHSIELVYGRDLAKQLSTNQGLAPGKTVRVTAVVIRTGEQYQLELEDPRALVVED